MNTNKIGQKSFQKESSRILKQNQRVFRKTWDYLKNKSEKSDEKPSNLLSGKIKEQKLRSRPMPIRIEMD